MMVWRVGLTSDNSDALRLTWNSSAWKPTPLRSDRGGDLAVDLDVAFGDGTVFLQLDYLGPQLDRSVERGGSMQLDVVGPGYPWGTIDIRDFSVPFTNGANDSGTGVAVEQRPDDTARHDLRPGPVDRRCGPSGDHLIAVGEALQSEAILVGRPTPEASAVRGPLPL